MILLSKVAPWPLLEEQIIFFFLLLLASDVSFQTQRVNQKEVVLSVDV